MNWISHVTSAAPAFYEVFAPDRADQTFRKPGSATASPCKRLAITKEVLIAKAEEVRLKAMEAGQFSAAIGAIREIGVLTGLRVERSERGAPHAFDDLSTADLVKELRALGVTKPGGRPPQIRKQATRNNADATRA